jgi:hypothetical protein
MHKLDEDSFAVVHSFHMQFHFLYTLTIVQLYPKKGQANKFKNRYSTIFHSFPNVERLLKN